MIARLLIHWLLDLFLGRASQPISAPQTSPRSPRPDYAAQAGRRAA